MTNNTAGANIIPRATGLIIVEVRNSNPNGDPERDGAPRKRRGDIGEISPVSVKRKMRDLVENKKGPIWLYLQNKFKLDETCFQMLEDRDRKRGEIKKMIIEDDSKPLAEKRFVKMYWDGRVFGNTFLEEAEGETEESTPDEKTPKKTGKGRSAKAEEAIALKRNVKTGVVHFGLGLSIAPVTVRSDFTLTNKAGVEEEKTAGMAPGAFKFVEHGIYAIPFFINPTQASKTGCTKADVDVAIELIPYVYSHNRSLVRTQVEVLHAWYMEHTNQKGSCNDFDLIDALMPKKIENKDKPSFSRAEYHIPKSLPDEFQGKVSLEDLMNRMKE
ncbi:MAG: CRISPR-associated protein [Deltaproteobacteria bacterium]|nr:CRISPR-associated protein [Deltaproteobacteria bacterium]MBM4346573.1 CRISPR-associated protein [Deltaproteobacteria bacterium]